MTTGKINYSPDYKSEKPKGVMISPHTGGAYADTREVIEDELERIKQMERARLEREVIEAARAWDHMSNSTAPEPIQLEYRNRLSRAVEALEEFEQKQK